MFRDKPEHIEKSVSTSGRTLDHAAHMYDLLSPPMMFYQEKRLSGKAIELLDLSGPEHVLDIGCATGSMTIMIAKKLSLLHDAGMVVGLDAAQKMITRARRKATKVSNIRFDYGVAEDLPYQSESFDSIISTFFFHHINFVLKKKVLSEIWRVLKKNGKAVIVDVDCPTTFFGALCAWSGYILFHQDEIKENIEGKIYDAIISSEFKNWQKVSHYLGYISIFKLVK